MELPHRLVRVVSLGSRGLLATDVRGRLHVIDHELRLQQSSSAAPGGLPNYCLAVQGDIAVTKDRLGNVSRWRLDTLEATATLAAAELRSSAAAYLEGEEPSPVINRGIAIWQDRVYVNNGYVQLVTLDLQDFSVLSIDEPFGASFIEWICTDRPGQQIVSDKDGHMYMGELSSLNFPTMLKIDEDSNVHRVLYDQRHDRYWATQDAGDSGTVRVANGILTVLPDGTIENKIEFAADDIECLAFSSDFRWAYTGGFDGELHVLDNETRELRIVRTFTDFTHEIIDLAVLDDDTLAVLTQDGQLVRMTSEGEILYRADFQGQCVWDIKAVPGEAGVYRLGTDTGVHTLVMKETHCGINPQVAQDWRLDLGFVRSIACSASRTFGVGHSGDVFCLDNAGNVLWRDNYRARLHTVALSPDQTRVLVASNAGAYEHDAATGARVASFDLDGHHAWVSGYLLTGERVVATHDFRVVVFDAEGTDKLWSVKCDGYAKRMRATAEHLYVTGGGGVRQISLEDQKVIREWSTLLDNTVENFAWLDDHLYAISYGCQLGVFDARTTEGLGLIEFLPDFPKGFMLHRSADGTPYLLIGGRGGYLQVRKVKEDGEPVLVRTAFLGR